MLSPFPQFLKFPGVCEFGEVAWFRSDLLPHHWHRYLNLLSRTPNAVLVSRSVEQFFLAVMPAGVLATLAVLISRIRVHEALKLGEE